MSILLFGFLNVTQMQLISVDVDVVPVEETDTPLEELTPDQLKLAPAIRFFETRKRIDARNKTRNFDLLTRKIEADNGIMIDIDTDEGLEASEKIETYVKEHDELPPENRDRLEKASETLKAGEHTVKDRGMTFSQL